MNIYIIINFSYLSILNIRRKINVIHSQFFIQNNKESFDSLPENPEEFN